MVPENAESGESAREQGEIGQDGGMDHMEEEYKKALEQIERYEKELARIKQAVIALSEGKPIDGYMDFDTDTFLEENDIWRKAYAALAQMMDNLMEIKYCTYYSVREELEKEYEKLREKVRMYTGWGWDSGEDALLIERLTGGFQGIYEYGVQCYKRAAKEQLDLRDMVSLLPEECPWTLGELMENDIYELLQKLPERERRR